MVDEGERVAVCKKSCMYARQRKSVALSGSVALALVHGRIRTLGGASTLVSVHDVPEVDMGTKLSKIWICIRVSLETFQFHPSIEFTQNSYARVHIVSHSQIRLLVP